MAFPSAVKDLGLFEEPVPWQPTPESGVWDPNAQCVAWQPISESEIWDPTTQSVAWQPTSEPDVNDSSAQPVAWQPTIASDIWGPDAPAWAGQGWSSNDSHTFGQYLICNKHKRLANRPQWNAKTKGYYHRVIIPKRDDRPGRCACDYTEYPALLKEVLAERQRPVSAHNGTMAKLHVLIVEQWSKPYGWAEPQPLRFLDLPPELRTKIYKLSLVQPEGIEFCPEPWQFTGSAPVGTIHKAEFDESWDNIRAHHTKKMADLAQAARLLRSCKQVYREASKIFYNENEFRFTNTSGFVALGIFLHRIGPFNSKMLRNITVRHPAWTVYPASLNGSDHFWKSIINMPNGYKGSRHLYFPRRWFDDLRDHSEHFGGGGARVRSFSLEANQTNTIRLMEKISGLRNLKLIMPSREYSSAEEADWWSYQVVDEKRFKNLTTTCISLRDEANDEPYNHASAKLVNTHNLRLEKVPGSKPWRALTTTFNGVGDWSLSQEEDTTVL